jgi:hypothetical protein
MGGGLIQLVAYGAQDMYLTGNPQITFFKAIYRRHTNFSIESVKQTFNGTADFDSSVSATISRNGDLLYRMYLQTTLPEINLSTDLSSGHYKAFRWLNWPGHNLLKYITLEIGGQEIDKHSGEWLHINNELTQKAEQAGAYAEMVGNVPRLTQVHSTNTSSTDCVIDEYTMFIPLQFYFCRNPGLALPIIALQYSDVKVNIEFNTLDKCIWATQQDTSTTYVYKTGSNVLSNVSLGTTNLYVDYIFLDTNERRRFAQVQHEYLIDKLQGLNKAVSVTSGTTQATVKINLNHPVKELIWVVQSNSHIDSNYSQARAGYQHYNYTDSWDYTNFTGTPEGYYGPGMPGGRRQQNIFYGLPTVKLTGLLNSNNAWSTSSTSVADADAAGYNDVSNYTASGTANTYGTRYMETLLGPAVAQPVSGNSNGVWTLTGNDAVFNDGGKNPTSSAKILLNGNERFSVRPGFYFNVVVPYECHTGSPAPGINVYSFALKPEDHQPSGTCNFSKIDNAELVIDLSTNIQNVNSKVKYFAVSYNILRIMSGMGGLAYSN